MEDDDDYPYSITIYPDRDVDKKPKTDAIGLVNVTIERKDEFDELWVVFDKDGYTKHQEAFKQAKTNNINIAFSSISFETWVLLHFEKCNSPFLKSAHIIENKFYNNGNYLTNYAKSGDYNVYPYVQASTSTAFKNASWLRNYLCFTNPNVKIYELNPYSDVDLLVKKLMLNEFVYEFRYLNQTMLFNQVEIVVQNEDNSCKVKIINLSQRSLVTNEFIFHDSGMNQIRIGNSIIKQGESVEIKLFEIDVFYNVFIDFENLKLEVASP